jgi:hypothetical protein
VTSDDKTEGTRLVDDDAGDDAEEQERAEHGTSDLSSIDDFGEILDRPARFFYFCPRASIAASTFGGDIGSSVSRWPVARSIALAMAAIGGQILTSAAPLAPYG